MGQSSSSPSRPPATPRPRTSRTRSVLRTVKRRSSQLLGRGRGRSASRDDKHEAQTHESIPEGIATPEAEPVPEQSLQNPPTAPTPTVVTSDSHRPDSAYSPGALVVVLTSTASEHGEAIDEQPQSTPEPVHETAPDVHATPAPQPTTQTHQVPQTRPLSPLSIHILGVILSVAAAAAAATLLPPSSPPPPNNTAAENTDRTRRMGSLFDSLPRHAPTSPATTPSPDINTAPDPRQLLLPEMARAFGLGAGNGDNSDTSTEPPPPAPEGSFERFLFDLQADLRTALSSPPASSTEDEQTENSEVAHAEPDECPPLSSTSSDSSESVASSHSLPEPQTEASSSSSPASSSSLPSDSQSSPLPSSPPAGPSRNGTSWWRIYRFPSVPAPPSAAATAARPGSNPLSGVEHDPTNPLLRPSLASLATASGLPSPPNADPPSDPTTPTTPGSNILIPAIIVGIQSGPPRALAGPPPQMRFGASPLSSDTPPPEPSTGGRRSSSDGSLPENTRDNAPSGREPGDTHAAEVGQDANRSFLIYIIAGYYPPTHIVNGSDLGQIEVVLSEMLDHLPRDQTASKEEIAQSKLNVVDAVSLKDKKDNEVVGNCIERCLICLEDYKPGEKARIMQCRHAFHKECVDMWMETGKNNCPACRGEGVSTAPSPHHWPPTSAAAPQS